MLYACELAAWHPWRGPPADVSGCRCPLPGNGTLPGAAAPAEEARPPPAPLHRGEAWVSFPSGPTLALVRGTQRGALQWLELEAEHMGARLAEGATVAVPTGLALVMAVARRRGFGR